MSGYFDNLKPLRHVVIEVGPDGKETPVDAIVPNIFNRKVTEFIGKYTLKKIYVKNERPDQLADRLYGNPKLDWIFFVLNDITPEEWPMTDIEFERWMVWRYGNKRTSTVRWVDKEGNEWLGNTIPRKIKTTEGEVGHWIDPTKIAAEVSHTPPDMISYLTTNSGDAIVTNGGLQIIVREEENTTTFSWVFVDASEISIENEEIERNENAKEILYVPQEFLGLFLNDYAKASIT